MNRKSNYVVIEEDFLGCEPLVIQDVGPWDRHPTVNNNAEAVVQELFDSGKLNEGQRLLCMDSEGQTDEILIRNRRFAGFKSWRPK